MTYPLIEGAYLRDLLEQPDALQRTLTLALPEGLSGIATRLAGPQPPFMVLTGMGYLLSCFESPRDSGWQNRESVLP